MKLHFQKAIMTSCRTEAGLLVEWRSEAGPFDFCRAMLCISAAYAVMRCLCVCVSVCLSVTFVYHVKTNFFHRRVATTF